MIREDADADHARGGHLENGRGGYDAAEGGADAARREMGGRGECM